MNRWYEMKSGMSFQEFMDEKRTLSRWDVVKIALVGAILGGMLTIGFSYLGFGF
jgi:hypothetical protein